MRLSSEATALGLISRGCLNIFPAVCSKPLVSVLTGDVPVTIESLPDENVGRESIGEGGLERQGHRYGGARPMRLVTCRKKA